jgi:hypothetical protein
MTKSRTHLYSVYSPKKKKKLAQMLAGVGLATIETKSHCIPESLSVKCTRELPGVQATERKGSSHDATGPVSS